MGRTPLELEMVALGLDGLRFVVWVSRGDPNRGIPGVGRFDPKILGVARVHPSRPTNAIDAVQSLAFGPNNFPRAGGL